MSQQLTTEEIQRLLEENYVYIKAIVDQQNLGRLSAMQEYQAKLQQNLMLLAAVADAQPSVTPPSASTGGTLPTPVQQAGATQAPTLFLGGGSQVPGGPFK